MLLALATPTAAVSDVDALRKRLDNVERLVERSSGARRIESNGNPQAAAKREQARALLARARERVAADDEAGSAKLLDEATRTMFEAVRLAGSQEVVEEKRTAEFDARARSIEALLAALERIAVEKGAQARTAEARAAVQGRVAEARRLASSGRLAEGRAVLDTAYDEAKRSIESLRGGDTLVRTLHFETKEEEYRYEVDRNDTHRMLVTVLLEDKRGSQGVDRMVQTFVERAAKLRAEAERLARGGEFDAAVGTLERSTQELVRAIRSAGVYIPG